MGLDEKPQEVSGDGLGRNRTRELERAERPQLPEAVRCPQGREQDDFREKCGTSCRKGL